MQSDRLVYEGFDLTLDNGFDADEAREVVDRVLATGGDRVAFAMSRPGTRGAPGKPPRLFVKAEFRRPDQPIAKRLRRSRAVAEGRGYQAFQAAGLAVPPVFLFGEQSRLRPRAGSVVVTEKIRGLDAARLWKREPKTSIGVRVARALAAIHAKGFVHGDAVMRNFVLVAAAEYAVDVPGWSKWTAEGAERDVALFAGSAMKLGADSAQVLRFLDEYAETLTDSDARPTRGWRPRVTAAADDYRRHLAERDATRAERHARRSRSEERKSAVPGERRP